MNAKIQGRRRVAHKRGWKFAGLEALETREVLSTFTVINIEDSGAGSFRQAILDANASSGQDSIVFAIPGTGVHSIRPTSQFPDVTDSAIIDGTTQQGYSAGKPVVELDGSNVYSTNFYYGPYRPRKTRGEWAFWKRGAGASWWCTYRFSCS